MNIKEFSHNLLNLYQEMSATFSSYQTSTGWACVNACGKCCQNPDVEASLYEMLPMAQKIYEDGLLEEWIEKLELSEREICLAFQPDQVEGQGKCVFYDERPGVCRMFGVAGYYNKKHEVTLSICKVIRDFHSIKEIPTDLDSNNTPIIADWNYKMGTLDQRLMQEKLPINEALKKALYKIALYSQFQSQDTKE